MAFGATQASSQARSGAASNWNQLEFLLGNWTGGTGDKDSRIGEAQGGTTFELELNRNIMVRRNWAVYADGRHDDLMIIYLEPGPHAIFFDSEGHVIRYNITIPEANRAIFESDPSQPWPRYRLSYWLEGQVLNGNFEIAPPGAGYQLYLQWTAKKK